MSALFTLIYCFVSQNDEFSEEELVRLMSALGSDGIDGGSDDTADANLIPMMQGMMKSLLSKDVLYPSLKDISAQVSKLFLHQVTCVIALCVTGNDHYIFSRVFSKHSFSAVSVPIFSKLCHTT